MNPQAEPSYQEAKMAKPTHEDALIVLQLAQLEATLNMSDASN